MKSSAVRNRIVAAAVCLAVSWAFSPVFAAGTDRLTEQAEQAFFLGRFGQAARIWQDTADRYRASGDQAGQVNSLIRLADTCLATGNIIQAKKIAASIDGLQAGISDPGLTVRFHSLQARIHYHSGEFDEAEFYFRQCLGSDGSLLDPGTRAAVSLDYANLLLAVNRYDRAGQIYRQVREDAGKENDRLLRMKAELNLIRLAADRDPGIDLIRQFRPVIAELEQMPDGHEKIMSLLGIGTLAVGHLKEAAKIHGKNDLMMLARDVLTSACRSARKIGHDRGYSFGMGTLGRLYAQNEQDEQAMRFFQKAIFAAHEVQATDILYRWQWENARAFWRQGDIDRAIECYRDAVVSISAIKEDLAVDCRRKSRMSFKESIGPVYFELADLLLRRSAGKSMPPGAARGDLVEARNTIEEMKKMELQDYFQDDCVVALKARQSFLDRDIPGTAVIYPVLLPDRIELIVTMEGRMAGYPVRVDRRTLTDQVRRLRQKLQDPGSRFSRYAEKLYQWLIHPIEADLQIYGIHTLVFIPDGPLRTVPMSVLFDGQQFLVEKYALATTPGLTVTDLGAFDPQNIKILLNGLTEGVQGFSPLPSVAGELDEISRLFAATTFIDQQFVNTALEKTLKQTPYSVVHIASHGQFDTDPEKTFLLTHDGRLTLDELENLMALSNFRTDPVELLTLSACQTAVGDDRAALGLAGVAVKSGARAALATLWFVDDRATSMLVVDFYNNLSDPRIHSKARALQQAQIALINTDTYHHPAFWAPFLLIGNWL